MNTAPKLDTDRGATLPQRLLIWEACHNVRDVGGYRTVDGGQIRWGALVRADNLCRLSQDGCAALAAYGIRTIIDLRFASELPIDPHPFTGSTNPVMYRHLPFIDETNNQAKAQAEKAPTLGAMYVVILEQSRPLVGAVMRAIAHAPEGGVLVHCFAGKDRTGLTVALALSLAGVPAETIVADYALSTQYLLPLYETSVARYSDPDKREKVRLNYAAPPEAMEEALAFLDRQTSKTDSTLRGIPAYLQDAGVSAVERGLIRQRLLASV